MLREHVSQVIFGDVEWEIADVQFGAHGELLSLVHRFSQGVPEDRVSNQQ
jgi:hypothetical protein